MIKNIDVYELPDSSRHLEFKLYAVKGKTISGKGYPHITDTNASDLIHDRIILEIKRLLIHTDLTNKEIAYRLNFEDTSYFNRFFRKREGMTPSTFRTVVLKKYQK